jgi:hypothetical protein
MSALGCVRTGGARPAEGVERQIAFIVWVENHSNETRLTHCMGARASLQRHGDQSAIRGC